MTGDLLPGLYLYTSTREKQTTLTGETRTHSHRCVNHFALNSLSHKSENRLFRFQRLVAGRRWFYPLSSSII